MRNIIGDKKHICPVCDASFTKGWSLKQHLTLHEANPSSLQCHVCDFTAPSKSRLQAHLATHVEPQSLEEAQFTFMETVNEETDQDSFNIEIQTSY